MKLSEYKNEDALDVLAEIFEPACNIIGDEKFQKLFNSGDKFKIIKYLLSNKKRQKDIIAILAAIDRTPVKKYEINLVALPAKIIEIFNDEELLNFFVSQGYGTEEESSGSATGNIEEIEAK